MRLRRIHDEARLLLDRFKPDVVALEELFVNVNVKTALAVGQARGVIILAAAERDLRLRSTTRRCRSSMSVTGYGRAEQAAGPGDDQGRCSGSTAIPQPDHAADALAVAICHAHASASGSAAAAPRTAARR